MYNWRATLPLLNKPKHDSLHKKTHRAVYREAPPKKGFRGD